MENDEDDGASQLELDSAIASVGSESRGRGEGLTAVSQCDSESVVVCDSVREQLAGDVTEESNPPAGGEEEGRVASVEVVGGGCESSPKECGAGVDVISGERESWAEVAAGGEEIEWDEMVGTGEEREEAVEESLVFDGIDEHTQVGDVGGGTVMDSGGRDTELEGDSLLMANVGDDTDIGTHIDVVDTVSDIGAHIDAENTVLGDDNTEHIEVADYYNDTELDDVGEDTHFTDTGNGMAHMGGEVEETEVVHVAEEVEVTEVVDDREVDDAVEEVEETEVVNAAEEVDDRELDDAAEEVEETEVDNAAEDVEGMEVTDVAEEVEETQVADAAEGAKETNVADVNEEIELADACEDAEEIEVADDAEESEETEVADDAEETEVADDAEETKVADVAEETEVAEDTVMEEAIKNGGKRKRGRIPKAVAKVPNKKGEEDVCFICFDGGELVLCDRRGCPKAYHPACVNRDEAFFRAKGKWNCGWHLCSNCEKNAHYMCYTCTFSLCKTCIKDAVILCVKGNKGFCEACMKIVMLIEQKEQENQEMTPVNFDDKSSWEYLFKDYWTELKENLHLTVDDITRAKNPWKGSHAHAGKQVSPDEPYDANEGGGSGSDSSGNAEATLPKKRKPKKRLKSQAKVADLPRKATVSRAEKAKDNVFEWASNELLEFVMHMKNGDKSVLSQFDVQALLLEYIKSNKLRDPRRKSQIICDQRLVNLFGKQRVGHFEMLKLIESHFHVREDSQADDLQGSIVDTETQLDADGSAETVAKVGKAKKRKRKNSSRVLQDNLDDYAAIDMHNISLIYLRRSLLEDLIEDIDNFHDKVVGTFVRIRISGAQKHDMYRLVQVVGTSKAAEPYKVGKRMTHTLLEILNLNKIEVLSIDIISNQEFTEDECKRLRQSIKCGLINRLTVGDIQEKAMTLQAVRVKDWFETEIVRLNHLRDRASDLGKKKQLRECVEKLQLLKMPEERQHRLEEIPEIHADPNMDPNYESEEAEGETDDKKQESYLSPRGTAFGRKGGREPISPRMGGSASSDSWSGTRNYPSMNRESSRSMSTKALFNKGDDAGSSGDLVTDNVWNQGRDMETPSNIHEKPKTASMVDAALRNISSAAVPGSFSSPPAPSLSMSVPQSTFKVNETEKIWHYRDPSGKVQGPFSIVQLRKWNKSGYFPTELKIWKVSENQDDSILLTDALAGKIQKEPPVSDNSPQKVQTMNSPHLSSYSGKPHGSTLQQGNEGRGEKSHFDQNRATLNPHGTLSSSGRPGSESWSPESDKTPLKGIATPSVEIPKHSAGGLRSDYNRIGSSKLSSPTPTAPGGPVERAYENKWSPTSFPVQSPFLKETGQRADSVPASSAVLPSNVHETNSYQKHSQSVAPSESQRLQVNSSMLQARSSSEASLITGADSKNVSASLQNLIQSLSSQVQPTGAHGWVSGVVANAEAVPSGPVVGSASQAWASVPSQKLEPNNMIPSSAPQPLYGNPTGVFPSSGFPGLPQPSDPWRPQLSAQQPNNMPSAAAHQQNNVVGHQQNNMPSVAPHQPNHQQTAVPHQPNHQQTVAPIPPWVGPIPGNPNMGWMGSAPGNLTWGPSGQVQGQTAGNANLGWAPPGQGQAHTPGNANPGWAPPGQLQAQTPGNANPGWAPPGQAPAPGNPNSSWAAPGQAPRPVNGNPGWIAPGQAPLPGNSNSGWNAPTGNSGMWANDQNHNGDRFSGQRDSNYGGAQPWNNNNSTRQSSFNGGGGGSRPRVCRFHENGHCKKGSSCNYSHS